MDRRHRTDLAGREICVGGRFAVGADRRIIEWDEAAARLLGVPRGRALGLSCGRVIGGRDDFGHAVCGLACPAWKALAAGKPTGTSKLLVRTVDGVRLRLACDLIALPGGGALANLRRADNAAPDLAHDLAGIAVLTAQAAGEPLHQALHHALDFLLERTDADAGEVFLAEPHGKGMVRTCHRGRFGRSFGELPRFDRGEGFPGLVLAHGQPVYSDHLAADPRFLRNQVKHVGFGAYLCHPLSCGGAALGCIALAFRRPNIDLDHVRDLLRWVGTPMGLVIDRALTRLRDAMTSPLHGVEDDPEHRLRRALRGLLREMVRVSHADGGELVLPAADGGLRCQFPPASVVPRCPTLCADAIGRCPTLKADVTSVLHGRRNSWPSGCHDVPHPGGAWCCIPMSCDGETLGLVRLLFRHLRPSPPGENIALLQAVASLAAEKVRDARDQLAWAPRAQARSRRSVGAFDAVGSTVGQPIAPAPDATTENRRSEARLVIRCLGSLELAVDGVRVVPAAIRRKRVLTLLGVLLAHHDRPQCKDVLIEMLWPGADPDVRTRQFHVLVHELRKLIEPPNRRGERRYVCSRADRYWFETRSSCWIDMIEFRGLLDLARNAEAAHEPQAAIGAYEAAADLYRGDYMEDEPFAEWCDQTREQLREDCLGMLGRLAMLWGALGRWDRSAAWSRRALSLDPLREEMHRALMYALWASGRRDEAVRQYEACAHLLGERLDLAPLPETEQLLARIRATARPRPPSH